MFTIPETFYPIAYIRNVLGIIFVLFLPGFAFIKALFPTTVPLKTTSESLDDIERVALSFGMSLALVPIVGLILNYTPWGIRLTPITLSLPSTNRDLRHSSHIKRTPNKTKNVKKLKKDPKDQAINLSFSVLKHLLDRPFDPRNIFLTAFQSISTSTPK